MRRALKPLSWVVGLAGLVAVVLYYEPGRLPALFGAVGITGVAGWVVATIAARIALAETTTAPLRALGHPMSRTVAFWVGWLRTFANQVFPAAGVVAYVQALRRKTDISWSELAALAAPQFVLAAAAIGGVGLCAVVLNLAGMGEAGPVLLLAYGLVLVAAWVTARGAHSIVRFLPATIAAKVAATSQALHKLARRPGLLLWIVACHVLAILSRGLRLWLLFELAGVSLDWQHAFLLVAIAESSILLQLTPGGLGIREGAVIAGAILVGAPAEVAAGVAVVDRLLVIAITALLTPPAMAAMRSDRPPAND